MSNNINKTIPAIKSVLSGKKVVLKTDARPTIGSNSIVTSDALANALMDKNVVIDGNTESIIPTGDIIRGKLEDGIFYIRKPNFVGVRWIPLEDPEVGKLYYDTPSKTYYMYYGNKIENDITVGYDFRPLIPSNIIKVTWQELKDLRDESKLVPGFKYRITDYQCTTTQENTRSAGHQFDIVLLALSENKLAEEGWAMIHNYDEQIPIIITTHIISAPIQTETINTLISYFEQHDNSPEDSASLRTWLESMTESDTDYTITSNGRFALSLNDAIIEADETGEVEISFYMPDFDEEAARESIEQEYFKNSNLSAWKVWYCLDNDKSRFVWADDSVDEGTPANITSSDVVYVRDATRDDETKEYPYGWVSESFSWRYTQSATPNVGDDISPNHNDLGGNPSRIQSYTPAHEGTGLPNGRGVIYRLIDEWNNDIPYDFKNILIYDETYSQYCYAIIDNTGNNFNVDPTLDGTKVKAIHVLCDNNDELKPIAKGGFWKNPLVNIIFLNNSILADEYSNCVVSNGLPIVS